MSVRNTVGLVVAALLLLVPTAGWSQQALGGIAGTVRDTTGAVLPGVTVEAASPALIERVRVVITDDRGLYRIVDLRPGTYNVTFMLPGFSTFKREGIELTTGFTAAVNAELRVGDLAETVTVTGASPIVDVQNVRTQTVLSRQVLDLLPTGKTVQGFAALTVGASVWCCSQGHMHDVGGDRGENYGSMLIHGSRQVDGRLLFDGMRFNNLFNQGGGMARSYFTNQVAITEVVLEKGGMSAETETASVQVNSVPKDGGNTFTVYVNTNGTNEHLMSSNLSERLRARGLATAGKIKTIYDAGVGLGGPIKRDRLWFYTAHRWWGNQFFTPGLYFNKTQGTPFYTPDLSRPAYVDNSQRDHSLRLTWQAASKHKITFSFSGQDNCQCYSTSGLQAPEARYDYVAAPSLAIGTWTYPATSRLLLEAGVARLQNIFQPRLAPGVTRNDIAITELSTNVTYNAQPSSLSRPW